MISADGVMAPLSVACTAAGTSTLAVLEGRFWDQVPAASGMGPAPEAAAFRAVALQPPLYAWLEAAALELSPDRSPVATVLPGYAAGVVAVGSEVYSRILHTNSRGATPPWVSQWTSWI